MNEVFDHHNLIFLGTFCLLFLVSSHNGLPQTGSGKPSGCLVTEKASGQQKPCILPFSFNNRIFPTCTNFTDTDGKRW